MIKAHIQAIGTTPPYRIFPVIKKDDGELYRATIYQKEASTITEYDLQELIAIAGRTKAFKIYVERD